MADHDEPTYRLTEIVGTSSDSIDQAVRNGLARAAQTIRHLDWFEVSQIRGTVTDGEVGVFQVTMKVRDWSETKGPFRKVLDMRMSAFVARTPERSVSTGPPIGRESSSADGDPGNETMDPGNGRGVIPPSGIPDANSQLFEIGMAPCSPPDSWKPQTGSDGPLLPPWVPEGLIARLPPDSSVGVTLSFESRPHLPIGSTELFGRWRPPTWTLHPFDAGAR